MNTIKNFDLSISIISFNTRMALRHCLKSIFRHSGQLKLEVLVVDNASTDGSLEMVTEEFSQVVLIRNSENVFFTKAHNQALKLARSPYCLILNSDTKLQPNTLSTAVKYLRLNPWIGALGVKHVLPDGALESTCQRFTHPLDEFFHSHIVAKMLPRPRRQNWIHYSGWDRETSRVVDAVSDACLFAPRQVLARIGYYDERLLLFFTENDLCLRINKAGWSVYHLADTSVRHTRSQSLRHFTPYENYRLYEHDLLVYYKKHFGYIWSIILKGMFLLNHLYYRLKKEGR